MSNTEACQTKILVAEPSLKHVGGHYFQYAVSVARAAQKLGWQAVIAANLECKTSAEGVEIIPAYEQDYWEKYRGVPGPDLSGSAVFRAYKWLGNLQYELPPKPLYIEAMKVVRGIRSRKKLLLLYLILLVPFLPALVPLGILAFVLTRPRIKHIFVRLLSRGQSAGHVDKYGEAVQAFCRNTISCCKQAELRAGDHFLFASASSAEVAGIIKALKEAPELKDVSFHLVLRRNLRDFPSQGYSITNGEIKGMQECARDILYGLQNIHLYTDTDALSYEYDATAKPGAYTTLPIPHVESFDVERPAKPLQIAYIGDARCEKGFQYLSRLVTMLQEMAPKDMFSFKFQTNASPGNKEGGCTISRQELLRSKLTALSLVNEAQDEKQYYDHLASSHIVLIPYDVNNYSQRSSGIFAESVGMGLPVVVPSGTWMSRELKGFEYRRIAKFLGAHNREMAGAESVILGTTDSKHLHGMPWIEQASAQELICTYNVKSAAQIVVEVPVVGRWFAKITCRQFSSAGVFLGCSTELAEAQNPDREVTSYHAFRLHPETVRVEISIVNSGLTPSQIKPLHLLDSEVEFRCGCSYDKWQEMSQMIIDMGNDYKTFVINMAEYRKEFLEFHCGTTLVKILAEKVEACKC